MYYSAIVFFKIKDFLAKIYQFWKQLRFEDFH
jgi:hypothetical protein